MATHSRKAVSSDVLNTHRHDTHTQRGSEKHECPETLKKSIEDYVRISTGAYTQGKTNAIRVFLDELDIRYASLQSRSAKDALFAYPTVSESSNSTHNRGLKSATTDSKQPRSIQETTQRRCRDQQEVTHGQIPRHNCPKRLKPYEAPHNQASQMKSQETSRLDGNNMVWSVYNAVLARTSDWTPKDRPSAVLVHQEVLYLTRLFDREGGTNLVRFMEAVRDMGGHSHRNTESTSSIRIVKVPQLFLDVLSSYREFKYYERQSVVTDFFSYIHLADLYRRNEELQADAENPEGEMRVVFEQLGWKNTRGRGYATLAANYLVCCLHDIDPQDPSKKGEIEVRKEKMKNEIGHGRSLHVLETFFGRGIFALLEDQCRSRYRRWRAPVLEIEADAFIKAFPQAKAVCKKLVELVVSPLLSNRQPLTLRIEQAVPLPQNLSWMDLVAVQPDTA